MKKIWDTVAFLNPGQTPVIAADQPLYALLKQIQWEWPEYGEDKFVIMFGGLHIEMAALKSLGTLLEDSGCTSAIVEAGLATSGTAESLIPDCIKCHQDHTGPPDHSMHPLQIDERSIWRLLFWGQLHWPLKNGVRSECMESTVLVLASGAGYGANHTYTDPLIQGRKLHTLPWNSLWTDPILLRKQQWELCLLASSSP